MSIGVTIKEPESWKPDRPTSSGATAFHNAVINASWLHDCVDKLTEFVAPRIRENDILVDFGAGTGTSSARILKKFDNKIRLWLLGKSPAWPGDSF